MAQRVPKTIASVPVEPTSSSDCEPATTAPAVGVAVGSKVVGGIARLGLEGLSDDGDACVALQRQLGCSAQHVVGQTM